MGTFHTGMVAELTTPLGKDAFVITDFTAVEAISEPFAFDIGAVSRNASIGSALGAPCTVALKADAGGVRFFNGILTDARRVERTGGWFRYALVLRPWLHLLDGPAGSRIFINMTARDILIEIFTAAGLQDFEFRLAADHPVLPHCAQYRESDLAFCTRLMEQHGIWYFFAHREGRHTLIMADAPSGHCADPGAPALTWLPARAGSHNARPPGPWISERLFHTAEVAVQDREEGLAPSSRLFASGSAVLSPGTLVNVEQHPADAENRTFLVTRCVHRFAHQLVPPFAPGRGGIETEGRTGGGETTYDGSYEFLPGDRPFTILPITEKPQIAGIQTARIASWPGVDGGDVGLDANGCIPVHFPWDRAPRQPCPVRVARTWSTSWSSAGDRRGAPFSLRAGTEVIVSFVDGDPAGRW
jgi:type VI secretion system secreted protein VgrG